MTPLVLASRSPRRRALLEALGLEIEVRVSDIDEATEGPPHELVLVNARAKRDAVASRLEPPAIVIAADTIVVLAGRIMGKPADLNEAREMLRDLSGATHEVITGIALCNLESGRGAEGYEVTEVTFQDLSDAEIDTFVDTVKPTDRAGAYTVEGPGSLLVSRFKGCYHNVLGLPMVRLDQLLRSLDDGLFDRIDAEHARFL